ncbi:MAG TPA: HupE/UreJ family protein, partial [Gemmatimonadaceae bacterium]|nr:HupE/UreJ family protein [Gemmatimonadaceae bacterium]
LAYGGAMLPYAMVLHDGQGQVVSTEWIAAGAASLPFSAHETRASTGKTVVRYLRLGFTHIVPLGLDHVLFVLGIFFSSARWRPVLAQVTAFTIAHSITLALAMTGVVQAPPSFVEPLIAASIVYVAVENLLTDRLRVWRLAVVFAFGLLHGLGFAGVLTSLGLPAGQLAWALAGFNVGVEFGQLAVIVAAAALLLLLRLVIKSPRERIAVPASCAIAIVGAYWTIERLGLLG